MKKLLAIDYGQKRMGIAISDGLGMCAYPRGFLNADAQFFKQLQGLIAQESISQLVVGLPHSLNGTLGPMAQEVLKFIEQLKTHVELPIIEWDERLSTAQAEKMLVASDVKRKDRKLARDSLAAVLILQSYLDAQR